MGHNLSLFIATRRVSEAKAAATEAIQSTEIDMSGFEGIRFVTLLGQIAETGTVDLKVFGTDVSGAYDQAEEIAATSQIVGEANNHKMLVVDVYHPHKRFLRVHIERGVANSSIDGILAELYRAEQMPVPVHGGVACQVVAHHRAGL